MQKKALTVNEAAEYSGIGRNTLRTLVGWGKIPVIQDTLSRAGKWAEKVVPNAPSTEKKPCFQGFFS